MAEEPDNLVLQMLRAIRANQNDHSARFDEIEAMLKDVRLAVASREWRFAALEEGVEAIRETAPIVEGLLEGATIDGIVVTDLLAYWREGHGADRP